MNGLQKLIDLTEKIKNETPEEKEVRIRTSLERLKQYDLECEERHRQRRVTQEQLNKVCDWHARND